MIPQSFQCMEALATQITLPKHLHPKKLNRGALFSLYIKVSNHYS